MAAAEAEAGLEIINGSLLKVCQTLEGAFPDDEVQVGNLSAIRLSLYAVCSFTDLRDVTCP